jgi:hypothetical protein
VSPPDAALEINGEDRGAVSGAAAREALRTLPAGVHRIVLRRSGHESWRGEVSVGAVSQTLEVTLTKLVDPGSEGARFHGEVAPTLPPPMR